MNLFDYEGQLIKDKLNYQIVKNEYSFSFTKSLGISFSCYIHLIVSLFQLPTETQAIIHSSDSFINQRITFTITENGFM